MLASLPGDAACAEDPRRRKAGTWLEAKPATSPILFIHDKDNSHVPVWHVQAAYRLLASADPHDGYASWVIPSVSHLETFEWAKLGYIERPLAGFDRLLLA